MVLRVEDLDPRARDRTTADLLMDDLDWLGLDWDEGPYRQSERGHAYEAAVDLLRGAGLTYPCFCTRSELHAATAPHASDGTYVYQGTCRDLTPEQVKRLSAVRPAATRVVVPAEGDPVGDITFDDLVYGEVRECLARDCGDFLVRRSDGVFAYQLAVVVDDAAMGVTQVVRGRDLLGSTCRQVWLQRVLGLATPEYAHVPLLVAPDGRRLSKRERDLDLGALRSSGMTARHLIGRLAASVGLAEQGEEVDADELVERFSWAALRSRVHEGDETSADVVVSPGFLD
jgi:glutamyl-tRNA synthetase